MEFTTLCYLEQEDSFLMLHRTKKKGDLNRDKWIGVGGHFEPGESPEDCLLREVFEETGLQLKKWSFRGIITFTYQRTSEDAQFTEYMCLYTASEWEGALRDCEEGDLVWVKKEKLCSLNLWEGDRIFLSLLQKNHPFFSLKLNYVGETLQAVILDGKEFSKPGVE